MSVSILPFELQKNIAGYLSVLDASRFSQCSQQMHRNLSLSTISLPLLLDATWHGNVNEGDTSQLARPIPIPFRNRVHSVILQGRWRDQGWGNRKGQVLLMAKRENEPDRIVLESDIAHHIDNDLRMVFHLVDNEVYSLYIKVGGGGGHSLHIKQMKTTLVIMDSDAKTLAVNFAALKDQGALKDESTFYIQLLRASAQALKTQLKTGAALDWNLKQLFESTGISVDKRNLDAWIEICNAFLDIYDELFTHELSCKRVEVPEIGFHQANMVAFQHFRLAIDIDSILEGAIVIDDAFEVEME